MIGSASTQMRSPELDDRFLTPEDNSMLKSNGMQMRKSRSKVERTHPQYSRCQSPKIIPAKDSMMAFDI
jgi:hypothetical protein